MKRTPLRRRKPLKNKAALRPSLPRKQGKRAAKPKTPSIKKLDALWSKIVRLRAGNICAMCGRYMRQDGTPWKMNAHHLIPKGRSVFFRWNLENGICLCFRCHRYERQAPHHSPEAFSIWLNAAHPDKAAWVEKNQHYVHTGKLNRQAIREALEDTLHHLAEAREEQQ